MVELNQQQREAAGFLHGTAVVIAVPGSGKTLTMTQRIANLVQNHGISPDNILGLTFTRNAAQTMRDRLMPLLDDLSGRVTLTTIHSFCHHLLRSEGFVYDILQGKDQLRLIRDIQKDLKLKHLALGTILREISLAKNNLITLEEFRCLYEGDTAMMQVSEVFEEYEDRKTVKHWLDFDDLLLETYRQLSESEAIREKYRQSFHHLLVDEFQDTNPVQMEILKLLLGNGNPESSFWVCGDDWQSIYAFNGASVGNILNFQKNFPEADIFVLNENYRSTPQILQACQNLISHNQRKIHKTLTTKNPDGDDITVLECVSEEDEAVQVCREIQGLVESERYTHKEIAVLYRANFQSRIIEERLSQEKIPYRIENGLNFYQRREIRWLMDYLRLINQPDSSEGDEAIRNILNVPNRYISRKFVEEVEDLAESKGIHLYAALKQAVWEPVYIRRSLEEFVMFLDSLMAQVNSLEPVVVIQLLRSALDYDRFVTEDEIPSPDDGKIANLNQLELAAAKFEALASFLEYAEAFSDESVGNDTSGVQLMTVHKAKGLEFAVVFLIGMVQGIMPSKKMGDIEEERRICFVGISRAMQRLYLSYSHHYLGVPAIKSIFLDEIQGTPETVSKDNEVAVVV